MFKCNHIYESDCNKCGLDATYKWITCPSYKLDCPDYVCTICGEITAIKKETVNVSR